MTGESGRCYCGRKHQGTVGKSALLEVYDDGVTEGPERDEAWTELAQRRRKLDEVKAKVQHMGRSDAQPLRTVDKPEGS